MRRDYLLVESENKLLTFAKHGSNSQREWTLAIAIVNRLTRLADRLLREHGAKLIIVSGCHISAARPTSISLQRVCIVITANQHRIDFSLSRPDEELVKEAH